MTVELTVPVTPSEAAAFRAAGHWADDIPVDGARLRASAERTAVIDRRGACTYGELADLAERLASAMADRGVGVGDAVVIVTDNDRESVAGYHATGRLGAVAVLVQKASGAAEVVFACDAAGCRLVLLAPGAEAFAADVRGPDREVRTIAEFHAVPRPPAPTVHPDADAARVIVFTSGTTSTPKGVVHTTNTLRACTANYRAMTALTPDDRFFLVSPLASMAGVLQVLELAPLLGAAAVLENAWSEEGTLDFLTQTNATFYGGTDVVIGRLLDVARGRGVDVPLRSLSLGGATLRSELMTAAELEFGINVLRVYGSSEAPNTTGSRPGEPRETRLDDEGLPGPGVELTVDSEGTQEVWLRGPHLFRGYLDPADNDQVFEGEWFRTGDAGEIVDGRLRIVGRLKDIANRNGKKISLAEVEQAFTAATGIDACAAFSVFDAITGERVVLAVQLPPGGALDARAALDDMVASGLAKWKLPESVLRYDTPFPMTATGKVKRRELSESHGSLCWRADRLAVSAHDR